MSVTTDFGALKSVSPTYRHTGIWSSGRNGWLEGEMNEAIFQNFSGKDGFLTRYDECHSELIPLRNTTVTLHVCPLGVKWTIPYLK